MYEERYILEAVKELFIHAFYKDRVRCSVTQPDACREDINQKTDYYII